MSKLWYTDYMGKYWTMSDEGKEKIRQAKLLEYKNRTFIGKCYYCGKLIKVPVRKKDQKFGYFCDKNCKDKGLKGKFLSTKGQFKKGTTPWNKGLESDGYKGLLNKNCLECNKQYHVTPSQIKRGKGRHCSRECQFLKAGTEYSCIVCGLVKKVVGKSKPRKYCSKICNGLGFRDSNHPSWNGGSAKEREIAKGRIEYKTWRKSVFIRDNYTCQLCWVRGVPIEADHIKEWANYPLLRYELSNGRTLCKPCHRQTPTWGRRSICVAV